jgi:hypothetical protein
MKLVNMNQDHSTIKLFANLKAGLGQMALKSFLKKTLIIIAMLKGHHFIFLNKNQNLREELFKI